ncbi:MAG: LytTR family DNA-binding domain-containing protein [Saprospiraceae bacterium]|nr:LytTR family DNA-binding domain-containing protein [Saprospiraceae bacterium]
MNKPLKCVIVDDEPPAIRLVENYIKKVSSLELVYSTTKPLEAVAYMERYDFDLIFLDIQMPHLTGIQLSKILRQNIKVIFTTAYPEFAVESYRLNATDYLLKPFDFERFYQAVKKAELSQLMAEGEEIKDYVFVKTNSKNSFEKARITDILYIEGLKNYVAIHLTNKQIVTYSTLKAIKESLPSALFVQIHKSYIIAISHIEKTDSISVTVGGADLPLGQSFKAGFFARIRESEL